MTETQKIHRSGVAQKLAQKLRMPRQVSLGYLLTGMRNTRRRKCTVVLAQRPSRHPNKDVQ